MAKILIDNGTGNDVINKTLVVAVNNGYTSMVILLLKSNISIDFIYLKCYNKMNIIFKINELLK